MAGTMNSDLHQRLKKPIRIREVWSENVMSEFQLISSLLPRYPFASVDTEYPGVVYPLPSADPTFLKNLLPVHSYQNLKANVDALNIIQVGITLSDANGELPDLGSEYFFIWEFNFCDFDVSRDFYNLGSVELLRKQGIDFEKNVKKGIDSACFGELLIRSRLVCNFSVVTWVSFHSCYDFAYLIKILTRRELPSELTHFMGLVKWFFGDSVYDVKHMMKYCEGLYGGVEQVAKTLCLERPIGRHHQAGSDSLLTLNIYFKIMEKYFGGNDACAEICRGALFSLC